MRSYQQFCGLAKALDVVGDRWSLLIVRELLLRGAARYSELQRGLPGIATNLLADRLRELEDAGVVRRDESPSPGAAARVALTEWGMQLKPIILALGRWAAPVMMQRPANGDRFRSHWMALPLGGYLVDRQPKRPRATIELRLGDEPLLIEAEHGEVSVHPGTAPSPDLVIAGPPEVVMQLLVARIDLATARKRGASVRGDPSALRRVQPRNARRPPPTESGTKGRRPAGTRRSSLRSTPH